MSNKVIPEPQAGGRYVRNVDSSLKLVEQTEEGRRRADHKVATPTTPTTPATPAAPPPAPEAAAVASTKNPKE